MSAFVGKWVRTKGETVVERRVDKEEFVKQIRYPPHVGGKPTCLGRLADQESMKEGKA